jgi:hypothetical protein
MHSSTSKHWCVYISKHVHLEKHLLLCSCALCKKKRKMNMYATTSLLSPLLLVQCVSDYISHKFMNMLHDMMYMYMFFTSFRIIFMYNIGLEELWFRKIVSVRK